MRTNEWLSLESVELILEKCVTRSPLMLFLFKVVAFSSKIFLHSLQSANQSSAKVFLFYSTSKVSVLVGFGDFCIIPSTTDLSP